MNKQIILELDEIVGELLLLGRKRLEKIAGPIDETFFTRPISELWHQRTSEGAARYHTIETISLALYCTCKLSILDRSSGTINRLNRIINSQNLDGLVLYSLIQLSKGEEYISTSDLITALQKERARKNGVHGAATRHEALKLLIAWTISLYTEERHCKEWQYGGKPSANKAAKALRKKVVEHGRSINSPLTGGAESVERTIAQWIRKHEKELNKQKN